MHIQREKEKKKKKEGDGREEKGLYENHGILPKRSA